jgi:GrpB-like predicted nucleotidyltransferase (UPF0157 family)
MVPRLQDHQSRTLQGFIGCKLLSIEHVDSTSVPLLPAKPIIDIDIDTIITGVNLPLTI